MFKMRNDFMLKFLLALVLVPTAFPLGSYGKRIEATSNTAPKKGALQVDDQSSHALRIANYSRHSVPLRNFLEDENDLENKPADAVDGEPGVSHGRGSLSARSISKNAANTEPTKTKGTSQLNMSAATGFRHSIAGIATQNNASKEPQKVEEEEEKLRNATIKLVLWLRNRLRRRLEEVATLEGDMETEKSLLKTLNDSITYTTTERSEEIRLKLETQKRLSDFQQKAEEPAQQLELTQSRAKKLSDELAILGEAYNGLAETHRALRDKLRASGFSHWLEARGNEYMPATAVGVLSKSTELFAPLAQGVEQAFELDKQLAVGVERMVPRLPPRSVLGTVFEDLVMLVPIIPVLVVVCEVLRRFHILSVLHLAMYVAGAFMTEAILLLVACALLGREALRGLQVVHPDALVAGALVNAGLFVGYMVTQCVITVLRFSKMELAQSLLGAAIGWQYYTSVFRPAVMDEAVSATVLSHLTVSVNFGLVVFEKKRVLNVRGSWEDKMNEILVGLESWVFETADAMAGVFVDCEADTNFYSETAYSEAGRSLSLLSEDRENKEAGKDDEISESTSSPDMRTGEAPPSYGRWAGARIITRARQLRSKHGIIAAEGSESDGSATYASCRE